MCGQITALGIEGQDRCVTHGCSHLRRRTTSKFICSRICGQSSLHSNKTHIVLGKL